MTTFRTGFFTGIILMALAVNTGASEAFDFKPDRLVLEQQVAERLHAQQVRLNEAINRLVMTFATQAPPAARAGLNSRNAIYQSVVVNPDLPRYRL